MLLLTVFIIVGSIGGCSDMKSLVGHSFEIKAAGILSSCWWCFCFIVLQELEYIPLYLSVPRNGGDGVDQRQRGKLWCRRLIFLASRHGLRSSVGRSCRSLGHQQGHVPRVPASAWLRLTSFTTASGLAAMAMRNHFEGSIGVLLEECERCFG